MDDNVKLAAILREQANLMHQTAEMIAAIAYAVEPTPEIKVVPEDPETKSVDDDLM